MSSERLRNADALLNEASLRLEEYRDAIGSDNYVMGRGLVEITRDFRVGLEAKCLIRRRQQVQAYLDKAQETHNRVQQLTSGLYYSS